MVTQGDKVTLDADYCDASERRCIEHFEKWADSHHYFSEWTACEKYCGHDVDATDVKGRKCAIELKYRALDIEEYDNYFIEADKLADGLLASRGGACIPLYVNFFRDGNVAVWNLSDPKVVPVKDKKRRRNKGTGVMDENVVYRLPVASARVSTLCPPVGRPAGKSGV